MSIANVGRLGWACVSVLVACTPTRSPAQAYAEALEAHGHVILEAASDGAGDERESAPEVEPDATRELAPEPEADPEPIPTLPTVRLASTFPNNVHIARPTEETGWTVDVINPYGPGDHDVYAAIAGAERDDFDRVELVPGAPGTPRGWKHGDTWTLITRGGVLRRSAARFVLGEGASELHLEVELRRAQTPARRSALAVRGRAVANDLVFRTPRPRRGEALGAGGLEALRTEVLAHVRDKEDRRLFKRARIAPGHVRIYDARLPEPFAEVVILNAPVRARDLAERASALLLRGRDGALQHVTIAGVQGEIALRAILDINGDGVDEAVYEDSYHEGAYDMMLHFDGDTPRIHVIAGDGA